MLVPSLLEIEDERAAREDQAIAVLERAQQEARLLGRVLRHDPVALASLQIELEQGHQLARLEQPIRAIAAARCGSKWSESTSSLWAICSAIRSLRAL